mmetsp:Transcript_19413/g.29816  ORF Transcript_19413/g.29816 Transcript_19413/m.29816 type:complete len:138 (-) Transcript_19413:1020-1433(-)
MSESMIIRKFNLAPDYQHVKASFRDTGKAVERMREGASERRSELREKRRIVVEERIPHYTLKKSKSLGRKTKAEFNDLDSEVGENDFDEQVPISHRSRQKSVKSTQRMNRLKEKQIVADQVTNRLLYDASSRKLNQV